MFERHADLTGKRNRSLISENVVDWIWFNFTLKRGIQTCYECQPQNDFAVSKLWLDRPFNCQWKFFCIDFVAMTTSLENLSNMFEIGNHKKATTAATNLKLQCIWLMLWAILCNVGCQIQNLVTMATSRENLSSIFEIPDSTQKTPP